MSPHYEPPSYPIPLDGPEHWLWVFHALNLHWSSILHMLMDIFQTILSKHPTLALSHWVQKSVLYVCVSFAALMYLDFCFSSESKRPLLYENVVIRSPENVQVRDYLNRTMKAHRKWGCSDHDQGPGDALGSKLDLEWENLSDHVSRGLLLFSH